MGQPGCNDVTPERGENYDGKSKGSMVRNTGSEVPGTGIDSPKSLKIECGIRAIKNFLGKCATDYILKTDFELLKRLSLTGGLRCKDLTKLLTKNGFATDCRYCSQARTYIGLPLPSFVNGIMALKFRNSTASHWVAWKNGNIIPSHGIKLSSVSDVYEYFPNFDGFGHRVALWDTKKQKNDIDIITATYSVRCQKTRCVGCCRMGHCADYKSDSDKGFNFVCV